MSKIIITENQLNRLLETGSNSAAMDLDIYVQPVNYDTDNGNLDEENAVEEIIGKLNELLSMFKSGKKTNSAQRSRIFKSLDDLNSNFDDIKYQR